jgi:DNA-directed RNA polymerase subunit F
MESKRKKRKYVLNVRLETEELRELNTITKIFKKGKSETIRYLIKNGISYQNKFADVEGKIIWKLESELLKIGLFKDQKTKRGKEKEIET